MIAAIPELIFLSDHTDRSNHSDRSDYMETRVKASFPVYVRKFTGVRVRSPHLKVRFKTRRYRFVPKN